MCMRVKDITQYLEQIAPLNYQESYDNAGLLTGTPDQEVDKVLLCLDATEKIVAEAQQKGAQMIIAHHPIIFGSLKKLTGSNYVERTVIAAIRAGIAIYAIHTNLDNMQQGVNQRIGAALGLPRGRILAPKKNLLYKLVVFVPHEAVEPVRAAVFKAGVGAIGDYSECSYALEGTGSFKPGSSAQPAVGQRGTRHYEPESRLEFLVEKPQLGGVLSAMVAAHPYEEVAHDVFPLDNAHATVGSGMITELEEPLETEVFLHRIKERMGGVVRHTAPVKEKLHRIAWCGGSGSFLLPQAIAAGADLFLTSDVKYHQFFDAENHLVLADIGHYENEQYTKELLADLLSEKFNNFAVLLSENSTNPINYL